MTAADHQPSRSCHLQGCDSPECALANYRYMAALRLDHHRGIRRLRDAAPVLEHIERLLANDWLVRQIAEASGVSISAIRYILNGQPTISRERARAILDVPIGPPPADTSIVGATGTVRRLRALACLGHTLDTIGTETGISRWRLGRIRCGQFAEIETAVAQAIADTYRRLATHRGNCAITIRRAANHNWHGPLDWDDIDDPNCQPETWGQSRANPDSRRVVVDVEQVARLTAAGRTAQQIADELGCHKRTVVRARGRADTELAA